MNNSGEVLRHGPEAGDPAAAGALDQAWRHHAATPATRAAAAIQVWDPALRVFHWSLAFAMAGAIVTGEIGGPWIEWHGRFGVAISGLLGFRLLWGLLGPETARFASFVRGPAAIRTYLRGQWHGIGHNPLGALSVLALLSLASLQVTSGLFANDDIAFQGPLAALVSTHWSDRAGALHQKLSWLLIALVGLHLAAIAWYRLARRQDLVRPMITGVVTASEPTAQLRGSAAPPHDPSRPGTGPSWSHARLAVALGGAAFVLAVASGQWLPQERPVPASTSLASSPSDAPAAKPAW